MAIPDYQAIMLPLLQHTADGEIHTARGLKEALADHFSLTPEERQRMTTSTFSRDAHDYVATIDPKVVLIDGRRLARLMIDCDVGVSIVEQYSIRRIDSDYFSED